ncbi:acetylcholine receptor subunit alpha-like [Ruditapes philippinarum]|uniref:acetylcholine receptor subunit alpha-like n=1 Tax=Ruditapes philippinarum TaxID=129788 RepID=UPI00295AEA8E|nr:acetylcholine receptor subunit alpha-like [Ruditapes philippinarum]
MYRLKYLKALLCLVLFNTTFIACHHVNDTYRLLRDKLSYYDKTIRPKINQSEQTVVYFTFGLLSLKELDEVNQRLSVAAFTSLVWTDELLRWTPNDYGNMTQLRTGSGKFWTPNLILVNSAESVNEPSMTPMVIQSNGQVIIFPTQSFSIPCDLDVTAYPFDRHVCLLALSSQIYETNELVIKPIKQEVDTSYFVSHGAWELQDSRIVDFTAQSFSNINIYLSFERKPRFVIFNVILPIMFLSFLSVFVFLIPSDSGERMSFTLTMLLAISVFLTLVGDNLPKISTFMPVLSYYIISMLVMCVSIALATILNLRLFHLDEAEPKPRCLTKVVTRCSKKAIAKHAIYPESPDRNDIGSKDIELLETSDDTHKKDHQSSTLQQYNNVKVNDNPDESVEQSTYPGSKITWKDISAVFDILFFLTFLVVFILATVTYVVVVLTNRRLTIDDAIMSLKMKFNIDV